LVEGGDETMDKSPIRFKVVCPCRIIRERTEANVAKRCPRCGGIPIPWRSRQTILAEAARLTAGPGDDDEGG